MVVTWLSENAGH